MLCHWSSNWICRISGSGKTLEVRTLGCARRSLLPLALSLPAISRLSASNLQNKGTQDLYWFGPPLWCNTLLQCGGGLPLGLMKNSYKGKNSLLMLRCSCAWRTCVGEILSLLVFHPFFRSLSRPPSLWWLVLLI